MTSAVFYARQATREKRREDLRPLSAGNPAASRRWSTESASLPPCLPHDFPKRGSWLRPSTYLHLCVIADRPTDRPPTSRQTDRRAEVGIGRPSEGWKDACMGISGRKSGEGREGRPFSQQRECKSNFNVDDLSRRSRSHRF